VDELADHDVVVEEWRRNAEMHDEENYQFLRNLKFRDYGFEPDDLAVELHRQAFHIVDCTRCANCCKTMDIRVSEEDVARIAGHLNMASAEFVERYAAVDEEGNRRFSQKPCPFLGEDDRCTIYAVRPTDCREYPHTDKEGFTFRTYGIADNSLVCPAVFYIIEQLRARGVNNRGR
jgi:hypothetical protein